MSNAMPEPLPSETPLRTLDHGRHEVTSLGDGRIELRIWHERLPGVTLEMVHWWFQHLDGRGRFRGLDEAYYRWWHPRDHVSIRASRNADGHIAPGCTIDIHEAFARDLRFRVKNQVTIHRWDEHGIGFHAHRLGHRVFELDHVFYDHSDGLEYESLMRVGASSGPLRHLIDQHVLPRAFPEEKTQAWLLHNIEEVGCLVDFLPDLYQAQ